MESSLLKKKILPLILLDILAAFDIYWTIYLGNLGKYNDWALYNLSVIGYWDHHEWELRIWGWVTSILFVGFLMFIYKIYDYRSKPGRILAVAAGVILSIGIVVPYQPIPNEGSWISNTHIAMSMLAPLSLVASMICFQINQLKKRKIFAVMLVVMVLMLAGAAGLFIKYTIITTILELYTVSCISIFLTIIVFLAPKTFE